MKVIISILTTLLIPLSLIAQIPLNGFVAHYPFRGNAEVGVINIEISGDTELVKAINGFMPGWIFTVYDFGFKEIQDKSGFIDLSPYYSGFCFPGKKEGLRLMEWAGNTFRDVHSHMDSGRKIFSDWTGNLKS